MTLFINVFYESVHINVLTLKSKPQTGGAFQYIYILSLIFIASSTSNQLVSWDEAVRRCNTSSDEPLYLPGFSVEEFQEAGEYMNKHEITSMWINLKSSFVFVWNNWSVYGRLWLCLMKELLINQT